MANTNARVLVVDDSTTVRRVVGRTLARAGYDVLLAGDGREGLDQAQRHVPDVVLVDQVMPNMDGVSFCRALRGIANLCDVPVVLMSALKGRIGEEVVEETGAVDAIGKPFGPEALLAVTAHALSRARERRLATTASGTLRAPSDTPAPPVEQPDTNALRAAHLAALVGPVVRRLSDIGTTEDADLARALTRDLPPGALESLADNLRALEPGAVEIALDGRTEHVPLGDVLQLLQHQRQNGVLCAERADRRVLICLRDGVVDLALGHGGGREFRLGRYLLEEELVDRDELEALVRHRSTPPRLIGRQLVKLGYIDGEDLTRVLVRQTSELIYEALRWRDGRYRFERFAQRAEAEDARLGLPVASILMEGLRRVDEWRLIEEQLSSWDLVLSPNRDAIAAMATDRLAHEERVMLEAIDGARTVRQIVEHTNMGSFDACKVLFQLVTSGLAKPSA